MAVTRSGERRVALVTGGNRGIGREVCSQLAALGYVVLLGARDPNKGRRAASRIEGDVESIELDVAYDTSVARAANEIGRRFGRLDVLVNNAGALYDTQNLAVSVDLADVRRGFETNLLGPWRVAQALLDLLVQSDGARVVNVSSEEGSLAYMDAGTPIYRTSKAALNALTRIMAAELRDSQILVNAVCPGWTATDMGGSGGREVAAGAASVVWAATLPDGGPTGGFFRDGERVPW